MSNVKACSPGEEREELWRKMVETYSDFDTYEARADAASGRRVPLIVLERAAAA